MPTHVSRRVLTVAAGLVLAGSGAFGASAAHAAPAPASVTSGISAASSVAGRSAPTRAAVSKASTAGQRKAAATGAAKRKAAARAAKRRAAAARAAAARRSAAARAAKRKASSRALRSATTVISGTARPRGTATSRSAAGRSVLPADLRSAAYTDAAGTTSTYHLFMSGLTSSAPKGLVVYLDGDGMWGHDHPTSSWALGGSSGVVAKAAARGYATLSIRTPDRRGTPTFWEDGRTNAAYVAALTASTKAQLGVHEVWLVGYSGGAQLITQYLLPAHGAQFPSGGAVIMGGGGAPYGRRATSSLPLGFSLYWYTGALDDGRGTSDGYDALADAKRGAAWYAARGYATTRVEPAGLDHEALGGRFGTVLAERLDAR